MNNNSSENHVSHVLSWIVVGALCIASELAGVYASEMPGRMASLGVSGANPPNAKKPNASDVNIVNTPSVIVANTTPVPVQMGFPEGFQPFITNMVLAVINGSLGGQSASFAVPAGKMLVIEQVNARIGLPFGQSIGSFALATQSLRGSSGIFFIAAQPQSIEANTGASTFIANSPLRAYVTPQSTVFFGFDRSSPDGSSNYGYVTVAGYLVDSPVSAN